MGGLIGAPTITATYCYPQLRYGTTPITIAIQRQAVAYVSSEGAQRGANLAASGRAEILFSRFEDAVRAELLCESEDYSRMRRWFRDSGARGDQFEFWVDRFTGSCWLFEDTLLDQNDRALELSSGSAAYANTARGRGINLSGTQRLSVTNATGGSSGSAAIYGLAGLFGAWDPGAPPTEAVEGVDTPLSHEQGTVVLDVVPAFAGNDSAEHVFIQAGGTANRLTLVKGADNLLKLEILDSSSAAKYIRGSATWSASTRVMIVASWSVTGVLGLWVSLDGGTTVTTMTDTGGAGSGIISVAPPTLYVGASGTATSHANGIYDTLMFQKRAWANPHRTLIHHRPVQRNYFPYAELTSPTWEPQIVNPSLHIWRWPLLLRLGVAP